MFNATLSATVLLTHCVVLLSLVKSWQCCINVFPCFSYFVAMFNNFFHEQGSKVP